MCVYARQGTRGQGHHKTYVWERTYFGRSIKRKLKYSWLRVRECTKERINLKVNCRGRGRMSAALFAPLVPGTRWVHWQPVPGLDCSSYLIKRKSEGSHAALSQDVWKDGVLKLSMARMAFCDVANMHHACVRYKTCHPAT